MQRSGNAAILRAPRRGSKPIIFKGRTIIICDQDPLHERNVGLSRGYTFADLLRDLNRRVFFWPGTASGPIDSGIRHFGRYADQRPAILRVELESLCTQNHEAIPLFCRYNSGSPRRIPPTGKGSPRGPNTFLPAAEFKGTPSNVVEVTFDVEVDLPSTTEFSYSPRGPWKALL